MQSHDFFSTMRLYNQETENEFINLCKSFDRGNNKSDIFSIKSEGEYSKENLILFEKLVNLKKRVNQELVLKVIYDAINGDKDKDLFYLLFENSYFDQLMSRYKSKELIKQIKGEKKILLHLLYLNSDKSCDIFKILFLALLLQNKDLIELCLSKIDKINISQRMKHCIHLALNLDNQLLSNLFFSNPFVVCSLLWDTAKEENIELLDDFLNRENVNVIFFFFFFFIILLF